MDKTTLLAYQPSYYKDSNVMDNINNANATELTIFNNAITRVYNNLYVDTADSDNLARIEKEIGLAIGTNYNTSYRISRIYSRLLGNGNFTKSFIKSIADSYTNGNTDVTVDSPHYSFTIKFTSVLGIPPNLQDLQDFIEDYKPAHFSVNYVFMYNAYNTLMNKTYSALSSYTNSQLRTIEL